MSAKHHAALRRIAKQVTEAAQAAVIAEAVAVEVDMKMAVPVRKTSGKIAGRGPGFLRDSIGRRKVGNDVTVGVQDPRAFYGRYLEFGTARPNQRKRPFVRPAWQASVERFPRRVTEHVKRALR